MSSLLRPPTSLENPDYFDLVQNQEKKEVSVVAELCIDTDGTMDESQSLSDRTDEEDAAAVASRIKICWFEEFSRLANADRPDDMKTFTYLEDF